VGFLRGSTDRRETRTGPHAKALRPLSDPGVVRRIAPFIATYCVGVALAFFAPSSSLRLVPLIAAAALTVVLSAAALCLPWKHLPAWTESTPVLASFAIIALLRHAEGDANLGYIALVMLPIIWMGVYGWEEFALALPDCDLTQARSIAARLLRVVPNGQTASIGLTQAQPQDTPRALIERADRALYAAKNGGRNQVKDYQAPPALGLVHGPGA
jgi:energy-converting hydrogenase Eha subunit E